MSSLLDALSDSENTIDLQDENLITPIHEFLEINPEKRLITIPESEQLFGVYGENKVEIKYFKCPRIILNDIDLYECYIFINYISASGKIGYIQADTVVLDETEDYIIFTWELTRNVFDENIDTDIYFSISAKQYLEDKEPVFFTRKAKGNLYETVYAEEQITEQYADIILQLLAEMDGVKQIATPEAINVQKVDCVVDVESDSIGIIDIGCLPSNFGVGDYIIDSEETIWKITSIDSNAIVKLTTDDISQVTKNTIKIDELSKEIDDHESRIKALEEGETGGSNIIFVDVEEGEIMNVGGLISATGISLDKTTLTFENSVSQTLIATVEPSDSTDMVIWKSSNPSIATVENGVVTPVANGSCSIIATAGNYSTSCTVTVDVAEEIVTYTITRNLTGCSTNSSVTSVNEGNAHTETITANSGYTLEGSTVTVTMGGTDISSNYVDGVLTIESVTGDIVISVIAVEESTEEEEPDYDFTGKDDMYIEDGYLWLNPERTSGMDGSNFVFGDQEELTSNAGCTSINMVSSFDSKFDKTSEVLCKDIIPFMSGYSTNNTNEFTWGTFEPDIHLGYILFKGIWIRYPYEYYSEAEGNIGKALSRVSARIPFKIADSYLEGYTVELTEEAIDSITSIARSTLGENGCYYGFAVFGGVGFKNTVQGMFCNKGGAIGSASHAEGDWGFECYSIQITNRLVFSIPSENFPDGLTVDTLKAYLKTQNIWWFGAQAS